MCCCPPYRTSANIKAWVGGVKPIVVIENGDKTRAAAAEDYEQIVVQEN